MWRYDKGDRVKTTCEGLLLFKTTQTTPQHYILPALLLGPVHTSQCQCYVFYYFPSIFLPKFYN